MYKHPKKGEGTFKKKHDETLSKHTEQRTGRPQRHRKKEQLNNRDSNGGSLNKH